jgi:hypothetical protein
MGSDGGFAPHFSLVGAAAEGGVSRCTSLGRFTMRSLVQAETVVRLQLSRNGHLGSHEQPRSPEGAEKRILAFTPLLVSDDAA